MNLMPAIEIKIENISESKVGRMKITAKNFCYGLAITTMLASPSLAGGFDRGGVVVDQLFDPESYTASVSSTYVNPQCDLNNIVRGVNVAAPFAPIPVPVDTTASLDVDGDYFVTQFGVKASLGDAACLATYSEPFGADAVYGTGHAYSATAVSFSVDT